MPIQVAAHGFEMTEALRQSCIDESKEKLQSLALHNFTAKWVLSLERGEHIAHVAWADGSFVGDVTCRTPDMYGSIRMCAKKAMEQIKKAHGKRYDVSRRNHETPIETVEAPITDDEE